MDPVNLAYDRYMKARHAIGFALAVLRELNQAAITYTQHLPPSDKLASQWRTQVGICSAAGHAFIWKTAPANRKTYFLRFLSQNTRRIIDLMDSTIRVLKVSATNTCNFDISDKQLIMDALPESTPGQILG